MMTFRILAVAALLTAALIWMIADKAYTLSSGRVINLEVEPVDPTDIFRGDYVVLNYKISRINLDTVEGPDEFARFEPVYVVLRNDGKNWIPAALAKEMVSAGPEQIVMRGTVQEVVRSGTPDTPNEVRVLYGIESYFVPQGAGKPIETERNERNVTIDIAVDSSGRSAVKALRISGDAVYEESLF
jgi:uncharacterized membrane-anchored protein